MNLSSLGYEKPLYILAFDHRATFVKELFNKKTSTDLTEEEKELIREFKMLIYKGFKKAVEEKIPTDNAAILCDEEYGEEVLFDARHNGYITILTIEKSGQDVFEFQYKDFEQHVEKFKPTFTKVLVKFNPKDSNDLKEKQQKNLKIISDYSHDNNYKFLLEVLVLPTKEQLEKIGGKRDNYDVKLRPELTAEVVSLLQAKGIEPDVWKLEGMDSANDYLGVIKEAKSGGRDKVSVVILGRGAEEEKVEQWLSIGSKVDGVIGFAVGRTIFWDSIEKFYKGEIGKAEVIETVSQKFQEFYNIFTSSK